MAAANFANRIRRGNSTATRSHRYTIPAQKIKGTKPFGNNHSRKGR